MPTLNWVPVFSNLQRNGIRRPAQWNRVRSFSTVQRCLPLRAKTPDTAHSRLQKQNNNSNKAPVTTYYELETCIDETCVDDERQFKTAKRPQAVTSDTFLKRFFCDNFVIFRHRSKRIAFWNQWIFLRVTIWKFSIFVMVTWPLFGTFQCLYLPNAWSQTLQSRLAKGTPSESRLSIGTIGLG